MVFTAWLLALASATAAPGAGSPPKCAPGVFSGEATPRGDAPLPLLITITCEPGSPGSLQLQVLPHPVPLRSALATPDNIIVTANFDGQPLKIDAHADGPEFAGRFTLGDSDGEVRLRRGQGAAPVSLAGGGIDLAITPVQRHADLDALAVGIEKYHANAFHLIPRAEWRRHVHALDERLDALPPDQLPMAFSELASLIGDGHTGVRLPSDTPRLPLGLMWFGKDLRVVRADLANRDLLGMRIATIGGEPLGRVHLQILRLIPQRQNHWLFLSRSPRLLRRGDVLGYLGLARGSAVRLSLQDDRGRTIERSIPLSGDVADAALIPVGGTLPRYQRRPGQPLWWEPLTADTIYVAFQDYDELRTRSAALLADIDRTRPARVILDLRDNPGGDFTVFRESLLAGILARPWLNRSGRLYAIINRGLFSAAMVNAADLLTRTHAIVVGEPIGERPNEYAEVRFFNLPNSHITYGVSTKYYRTVPGDPAAIRPQIAVPTQWNDFAAGRDTILDWILARPIRP